MNPIPPTEDGYTLATLTPAPTAAATQNACKLCAPLGASLVFKGIAGGVPLLHGSQGCSTYIRRYLISHFKEPMDIACSNFGEQTAVFGGGANLQLALENVCRQYDPALIGVATTCLSETIGDDVPMFIKTFQAAVDAGARPPIVHVSTPSYQGSHMEGFQRAVRAVLAALAQGRGGTAPDRVNLLPGLLSPADLRHLREMAAAFGLRAMVLPDYSDTLDGGQWQSYQRIPPGGTPVRDIIAAGDAAATIELGHTAAAERDTAATDLETRCGVPARRLGLPVGIRHTDALLQTLAEISGRPVPDRFRAQRGRLLDTLVDGHKHVNTVRAAVYGEADLVAGLAAFMAEIGIHPVVCASGGAGRHLAPVLRQLVPVRQHAGMTILEGADFAAIEEAVAAARPDLIVGHSKGYAMARRLGIPLVRVGFPIHDRMGGPRLLHVGYEGAASLFDRLANALIETRQAASPVGYTYM